MIECTCGNSDYHANILVSNTDVSAKFIVKSALDVTTIVYLDPNSLVKLIRELKAVLMLLTEQE